MVNQSMQLAKTEKKNRLPIISDNEKIQKICMKLYIYLNTISYHRGNDFRQFHQNSFNISSIAKATKLHPKTIKKYWRLLEHLNIIHCIDTEAEEEFHTVSQTEWDKKFIARKKYPMLRYEIFKSEPYRLIPYETLIKMRDNFCCLEDKEIKLWLLLLQWQEIEIEKDNTTAITCTTSDLMSLLGYKNHMSNRKAIVQQMAWLQEIGALHYSRVKKNDKKYFWYIDKINYYLENDLLNNEETITEERKQEILEYFSKINERFILEEE